MKNRKDTLIKVLSLGVGLAVGIVLIAKVFFELSYDSFYQDIDRVYKIKSVYTTNGKSEEYGGVSGGVALGFMQEVPGVEYGTRVRFVFSSDIYVDGEGNKLKGALCLADTCFFKVFDRPILAGDPVKALAKPHSVMVSRSFAEKLADGMSVQGGFDAGGVIGKQFFNEDDRYDVFTVEGVYEDFPVNGSLDYDILLSMATYRKSSSENWIGDDGYSGFVKLYPGVDPHGLKPAIRKMQELYQPLAEYELKGLSLEYTLKPFSTLHTSDPMVHVQVILLSIVAALLILISLLNYILIVISSLVKRSKEVGVRKCYGAESRHIYGLLARESLLNIFLALVLAAAIIFAGRSIVESLLGVPFTTLLVPASIVAIAAVILFVLVISIVVPAELYQRIPVYAALKNYTEHSRKWKLGLLGVQVLVNVFLVVMLFIIAGQYKKVTHLDPGYDYKNVYHINLFDGDGDAKLLATKTLRDLPEVRGVVGAYQLPYVHPSGNNVYLPNDDRELFNFSDQYSVSDGFFELLGIDIIDGRAPGNNDEIVVSRSFVDAMSEFTDWSDGAVGKQVFVTGHTNENVTQIGAMEASPYTISGVCENYLLSDLQNPDIRPIVLFHADPESGWLPHIIFKLDASAGRPGETREKVRQALEQALPGRDIQIFSWEEDIRSAYDGSRKMRNTLILGVFFSLFIALMGLIGFVRDESLRRSKEMAIRKINGATTRDILESFALSILKLSAVMAVLACAGAYFVAGKWLEQFAEKVTLNPLYFIGGALAVLAFVLVVVVLNCLRIAHANPVESLKNE